MPQHEVQASNLKHRKLGTFCKTDLARHQLFGSTRFCTLQGTQSFNTSRGGSCFGKSKSHISGQPQPVPTKKTQRSKRIFTLTYSLFIKKLEKYFYQLFLYGLAVASKDIQALKINTEIMNSPPSFPKLAEIHFQNNNRIPKNVGQRKCIKKFHLTTAFFLSAKFPTFVLGHLRLFTLLIV